MRNERNLKLRIALVVAVVAAVVFAMTVLRPANAGPILKNGGAPLPAVNSYRGLAA